MQKTADEMRISDWSSDVCSSDLVDGAHLPGSLPGQRHRLAAELRGTFVGGVRVVQPVAAVRGRLLEQGDDRVAGDLHPHRVLLPRSEEHTSELQSLMRISYAVFCLKKKTNIQPDTSMISY